MPRFYSGLILMRFLDIKFVMGWFYSHYLGFPQSVSFLLCSILLLILILFYLNDKPGDRQT